MEVKIYQKYKKWICEITTMDGKVHTSEWESESKVVAWSEYNFSEKLNNTKKMGDFLKWVK